MSALEWTVYTTEDCAPWAVFVDGHVPMDDASDAFNEMMVELLEEQGFDRMDARAYVEEAKFGHYWIRQGETDDEDTDPEYPWLWSKEGVEGARAITGLKFPA